MSLCSRPVPGCPDCGDVLIHQSNRGPHESSSEFGQYVHDRGERDRGIWRQMWWMDVDGAIFKKQTKVLRIIEHKNRSDSLSRGQSEVLPLLAKALQLLTATGLIHEQSGVFVVYSNHPHTTALVEQIGGWGARGKPSPPVDMSGDVFDSFVLGEPINQSREAA